MLAPSGGGLILYQAYGNLYVMTEPGDGVTTIKRRRHNIHGDGVRDSTMASGRGDLKYGKRFFSQKGSGGGSDVKEMKQGDGGAHSLGNGGALSGMGAAKISNTVNDVGKDSDGLNLSPTKVTLRNSAVNKEGNLHDENDGLTPSKSAANPNKGTSYANIFTDGPSRKAMNFCTLFTLAGNRVDVAVPVEYPHLFAKTTPSSSAAL
ncbi:hypothetical protein Tco_1530276 [Tanacetum coccineum]